MNKRSKIVSDNLLLTTRMNKGAIVEKTKRQKGEREKGGKKEERKRKNGGKEGA